MRVPLEWLREFVALDEPVEALAERLPMLGLGVDGVLEAEGTPVLDLEVASNRPDLLSVAGVAREVAAAWGRQVRLPEGPLPAPAGGPAPAVTVDEPALCPRFTAHVITGVRVGPSPAWMVRRLEAAGVRAINNVVDVTNYVMLERGQPMHAFDLARLAGGRLRVRHARAGERLVTLDGVERVLDDQVLVVADAERAQSLAGIIGGQPTAISDRTETVLLEAATWSPALIRRTSRRLGVRTESSARFERRIDPETVLAAARRAVALLLEIAGGTLAAPATDVYPAPAARPSIALRPARIRRLLGIEVPPREVEALLRRLGCEVRPRPDGGEAWTVIPPPGRVDLEREEDLVEEVARHHGYERVPETMPVEVVQQGRRAPRLEAEAAARDALMRAGLTEALTVSLVHPRLLAALGPDAQAQPMVQIQNPLTADHTHLRPMLLPGLLDAVRINASRRRDAVHLFEIGRVFAPGADGVPHERRSLALALRGPWGRGDWSRPEVEVTFFHLRGVLDVLVRELGAGPLGVTAGGPGWLHPGRAAALDLGGAPLGVAGELHPQAAARFDLPGRTLVAELDLDLLLDRARLQPQFVGIPRYPAVRRDLAVVAPDDLPQAAVAQTLRAAAGPWLEDLELFDVYSGPPLAAGTRNLAYALTWRAQDRTLTGEEVDRLMAEIHRVLPERLPVTIRT